MALEQIVLGADGAHFTVNGHAMHSTLAGRGHLRNVALALTYALASGVSVEAARGVLGRLVPLHRRMERYRNQKPAGVPQWVVTAFESVTGIRYARR